MGNASTGTASTASTRGGTRILSICAVYGGSMKYIPTIYMCTVVSIIHPHSFADSIHCGRMVPRMGVEANYFRAGNSRT